MMADPRQQVAYPPIQRNIKLEIPDEHQEVNTVGEEENWRLQKLLKIPDEQRDVNSVEEENWILQVQYSSLLF